MNQRKALRAGRYWPGLGWRQLGAAIAFGLCAGTSHAKPYTPQQDSEVLQLLPGRPGEQPEERRERRSLQVAQRQAPQDLPLALAQARSAIERARLLGDPRELGLAQAALAPWWEQPTPPPAVQLSRALVRQSQHDFAEALADLAALSTEGTAQVGATRRNIPPAIEAQATLTRSAVLQVLGRLDEAGKACQRLQAPAFASLGAGLGLAARTCQAELQSLQGRAPEAEQALRALAGQMPATVAPGMAAWLALVRAELAERMGRAQADDLYRQATAGQAEVYALAARADYLLAQGRPQEVLSLLKGREEADALLLRWVIAQQRLGRAVDAAEAATARQRLEGRFELARARGDQSHAREQARFALDVAHDPAEALRLALVNWQVQKEPADLLLLLRASAEQGDGPAAAPALAWAWQQGWVDARWPQAFRGAQGAPGPGRSLASASAAAFGPGAPVNRVKRP